MYIGSYFIILRRNGIRIDSCIDNYIYIHIYICNLIMYFPIHPSTDTKISIS